MSEDPTSWYCWWAPLKDLEKDLGVREFWGKMTPKQKRRTLWICGVVFLVEVPLFFYILTALTRMAGQ
jgi:hypothetical protein